MPIRELMTPGDVSEFLQLPRRSVFELARRGVIPAPVDLGHRTKRWRRDELLSAFGIDATRPAGESAGGQPEGH